jgi:chorismate synthase
MCLPRYGKQASVATVDRRETNGFEVGSGFARTLLTGQEHNDHQGEGEIRTVTNRSGGVHGGISNGENIVTRAAFKPTAAVCKSPRTVNHPRGQEPA